MLMIDSEKVRQTMFNLVIGVKELAEKTSSAIKEINELIEELTNIKKNYIMKLKKIQENGLQSINLIKSFYYEYYSDLEKIDTDNDIFSLLYLASYKKELDNFEMKYNIGIFPKLEEVHTQIKNLKSLTENPFALNMNYIDIPSTFREVIRTIGHEGVINCLSKIGDSQFISGSSDNSIKFWNLEDEELKPYECIDKYTGEVGCILLLKDNRLCYTSLNDSWIKIYEKIKTFNKDEEQTSSEYKYSVSITLSEHSKSITGLIQLDNNNLISASRDDKIIIWKMVKDNFIKDIELKDVHISEEKGGGVYSLCKLQKNNFLSGGADGKIKYWKIDLDKNEYICFQEFGEHNNKVRKMTLLKDDNLLDGNHDVVLSEVVVNVNEELVEKQNLRMELINRLKNTLTADDLKYRFPKYYNRTKTGRSDATEHIFGPLALKLFSDSAYRKAARIMLQELFDKNIITQWPAFKEAERRYLETKRAEQKVDNVQEES